MREIEKRSTQSSKGSLGTKLGNGRKNKKEKEEFILSHRF